MIPIFHRLRAEFVTFIISEYYRVLQLNDEQVNARNHYYDLVEVYDGREPPRGEEARI